MKAHLTREEVNGWLIGERSAEARAHVETCAECAAEIERVEAPVAAFRGTVREWSAREMRPARAIERRAAFSGWLRLAFAAGALALMIGFGVDWHSRQAEAAARADKALLESVDAEVAQTVPASLAPLANLMSSSSSSTDQGSDK